MDKAKVLEKLIDDTGYSKRAFAEKCGISESTLYSILKRGVGGASVNTVMRICGQLGITVEQLDEMAHGVKQEEKTYDDVERLIARNGRQMTEAQKLRLIQLLSEVEDNLDEKD